MYVDTFWCLSQLCLAPQHGRQEHSCPNTNPAGMEPAQPQGLHMLGSGLVSQDLPGFCAPAKMSKNPRLCIGATVLSSKGWYWPDGCYCLLACSVWIHYITPIKRGEKPAWELTNTQQWACCNWWSRGKIDKVILRDIRKKIITRKVSLGEKRELSTRNQTEKLLRSPICYFQSPGRSCL